MARAAHFLLVCVAACGGAPQTIGVSDAQDVDASLGPDDVFDIRVYGEEDLSGSYRVSQDGSIDFPLIGRTRVAGLDPTEVADLVKSRLMEEQILLAPQVSVFVQEYASKRISVVGAVSAPGTFPMTAGLTVVQAISLAGGFDNANSNSTVLTRRVDGELRRFTVRANDISRGRADDVPVRAGDIIFVPGSTF